MSTRITVALAGNPNSGKTTLFNRLTGANQHVANYPGVTVETKHGRCSHKGADMRVVDLPGTHSLTAYSVEELVARNFLLERKPDVVVDIIDSSNLERNLYLAVQLIELGVPLVLAFNMSDVARARGMEFDLALLSKLLGAPVVATVGHKGVGTDELLDAVLEVAANPTARQRPVVRYGAEVDEEIDRVESALDRAGAGDENGGNRWLALKLLEDDDDVREKIASEEILALARERTAHLERVRGDSPQVLIADRRYGFISGACQEAVRRTVEARHIHSDKIDAVLTHRVVGLPIFLALMYMAFHLTFTLGEAPMDWIERCFGWLGETISHLWPKSADSPLQSLLVDGVIGGVGGVIVFLPNILLLFLAIAVLEDSGYMARAAFLMDRLMHKIGLHGKSFIPMLIGFGCSVPAIMATRTLASRRGRLTTMLVIPLMSCGARLPIYALIIPAFFPRAWRGPVLWSVYLIGIVLAVILARLLRATLFRGEAPAFVMELPPYRMPTLNGVLRHMWSRGWLYLRKAGTIILLVSIVLWALTSYPKKAAYDVDYEGQTATARQEYLGKVRELSVALDPAERSDFLLQAVEAELASEQAAEAHWPHEQGFKDTEAARNAAFAELKAGSHGPMLTRFLQTRRGIENARAAFEKAVEAGVEEGSAEYADLAHHRDEQIEQIRARGPALGATVLRYLDQAKGPFDERMAEIRQTMRAEELSHTAAGRIGRGLGVVLQPLGFDWKIGTALLGALAAKEVFVAQLGIVYSVGEADEGSQALRRKLQANYTPLQGFCIMLFCLISAPCVATIAATKQESGSWKWAMLQLGGLTALAYGITLAVFQIGRLLA